MVAFRLGPETGASDADFLNADRVYRADVTSLILFGIEEVSARKEDLVERAGIEPVYAFKSAKCRRVRNLQTAKS